MLRILSNCRSGSFGLTTACARMFSASGASSVDSKFNVFAKVSDVVGVPGNTGESSDKRRPPSKRVLDLVDKILDLSLLEAADLCDICQERLSERTGGIPMRTPFVHPGAMFGSPMMGGMMHGVPAQGAPSSGAPQTPATPSATEEKAAEAPKEEEKSIVSVKLVSYAADKRVGVIKEVRGILGLGLKESKELVEGVPKIIKRGLPREEAEQLKTKLEAAGGVVEFS
jgi:large subunit ribosomal protein L7/L12